MGILRWLERLSVEAGESKSWQPERQMEEGRGFRIGPLRTFAGRMAYRVFVCSFISICACLGSWCVVWSWRLCV